MKMDSIFSYPRESPAMSKKFAILVVSCDLYNDLWPICISSLDRYLDISQYKVYLLTNFLDFSYKDVEVIKTGIDISWSDNLSLALDQIDEEVVMLALDDLIITKSLGAEKLGFLVDQFVDNNMNYFRLNPTPGPDKKINKYFGSVIGSAAYRTSTVFSIWKKEVLKSLLLSGESPWDFELIGSKRSEYINGWYASTVVNLQFENLVIKGKYNLFALWKLKMSRHSLSKTRPCMDVYDIIYLVVVNIRSLLFRMLFSSSARSRIRRYIRQTYKH